MVRRFHSPDGELSTLAPDDPRDVEVLVQVMAGPNDGPGEESFDVVVCTLGRMSRLLEEQGPMVGRHRVVVAEWDWPRIKLFLTEEFEAIEEPTWPELASKLGRVGKWEFEDYTP